MDIFKLPLSVIIICIGSICEDVVALAAVEAVPVAVVVAAATVAAVEIDLGELDT